LSSELLNPAALTIKRPRARWLWVVGIGVYAAVIWYMGWAKLKDAIASIEPFYVGLMMLMILAATALRALKWRLALGANQNAVGLYFLSKAAGGWTPGRAGELAPLLLKKHRTPKMAAWIFFDRILETAATLVLGLLGVMVLGLSLNNIALLFVIALILLVGMPLAVLTRPQLLVHFAAKTKEGSFLRRMAMLGIAVSQETVSLGAKAPLASVLTLMATTLDLAAGLFLYLSFGHLVLFSLLATAQCAHGLASAVPFLPNATGVPYLAAAGLLYQFGGVPEGALAAAVGVNLAVSNIVFWTSFGIGATAFRSSRAKDANQGQTFDELASGELLYDYEPESLELVKSLVPRHGRVLDLGCGDGVLGQAFEADSVVGIELSARCASLAGKRGLLALVANGQTGLPFADGTFETTTCLNILHHLPGAWDEVLRELDRVLTPGGRMVIVEPDARYALVRWTQAPNSPIRVAPCDNEPAIHPRDLLNILDTMGYSYSCRPVRMIGHQMERSTFPLRQRLLKAPFVIILSWLHGKRPNKFAIVAHKPDLGTPLSRVACGGQECPPSGEATD